MIKDILIIIFSILISALISYGVIYVILRSIKKLWRKRVKKGKFNSHLPKDSPASSFDVSGKDFTEQKRNPYDE